LPLSGLLIRLGGVVSAIGRCETFSW
jgi:hypothetical protein